MINYFSKYKFIFYLCNFILIVLYLFPGSLLGCYIYNDCKIQPQITANYIVSTNHLYAYIVLSIIGFLTYRKNNQFNILSIYLIFLSIVLEMLQYFVPNRSFEFSDLEAYDSVCDYFLFDTKGDLPGGNGTRFNWSLLRDYPATKPFFLSGGIGPKDQDAIASIINLNLPIYAVDINSKFEDQPAFKNIEMIKQFKATL